LEDLSAINYRLQGLVEKKPETQETILVKRRKHRAISIKGRGWALCVKVGSLEGVICRLVETHKTYLIITGKKAGAMCKTAMSSPTSEQNSHRRKEVLAGGGADGWTATGSSN
jgi:hypothetical protein